MYRSGEEYEYICNVIIDIFIDYDIKSFPIDEKDICRKMGIALVPYSTYDSDAIELLKRKSKLGFFVKGSTESPPTIYYNDLRLSKGEVRFTIFHELKHYVFEDDDDEKDDLADFFARYFMCPIPYLLLKKIDTENEIMAFCETSSTAARNAYSNIVNRRNKYGYHIFDYEIRLINQIEPVLLEVYKL